MCMGYGYCCCCEKCRWSTDGFSETLVVERVLLAATEAGYAVEVVPDDGTTLKCNGRTRSKRLPSLQVAMGCTFDDLRPAGTINPLAFGWETANKVAIFPAGWTWTPDGQFHRCGFRRDGQVRAFTQTFNDNGPGGSWGDPFHQDYVMDMDVSGVPDVVTWNGAPAVNICIRQGGMIYERLGSSDVEHILQDGTRWSAGDPLTAVNVSGNWSRLANPNKAYVRANMWSGIPGVDYGPSGWGWNRWVPASEFYYDAGSPHPMNGTSKTQGDPDNSIGAPDWDVGFFVDFSPLNQGGGPTWSTNLALPMPRKAAYQRHRVDSICIMIDPRTYDT